MFFGHVRAAGDVLVLVRDRAMVGRRTTQEGKFVLFFSGACISSVGSLILVRKVFFYEWFVLPSFSLSTSLHFPDPFDWGSFSVFLYFGIGNPVWDFLSNLHSFALSGSCSIDEVILHPSQGSQFLVFGGVGGGGLVLGFISRNGLCR